MTRQRCALVARHKTSACVRRRVATASLFIALSASALAQTVTTEVSLGWTAPTKNLDGSAIAGTLTYAVFQGPAAGPFTQVASGLTGVSTIISSATAGNCFAVEAIETLGASSTASGLSPTVCAALPSPASGLTISITLTVK
jgi:hypothetical protein